MTQPANTLAVDPPVLSLRSLAPDDHRYAAATWRESYKESSPQLLRAPWAMYKATVGKQLTELVASSQTLGAYNDDGRVIGWIAYVPGRTISTVHWCHTRFKLEHPDGHDEQCRRRGVMTLLLDAAGLGKRFAYTFRGPRRTIHHGSKDRSPDAPKNTIRGDTLDVALAESLRKRGVTAAYVAYEEWIR